MTLVYFLCCVSPAASEVEAKAQQQTDIQLYVCLRAHSGGSPSLSPLPQPRLLSAGVATSPPGSLFLSASGLLTFRRNFTCSTYAASSITALREVLENFLRQDGLNQVSY